jgi:hypothetical protein
MGYPVPLNSPQFQVNGQTYAIASFVWDNIMGSAYYIGVFVKMNDGSWNSVTTAGNGVVAQYMNAGDVLADMQLKGGKVKYFQWIVARFNAILAAMFKAAPPVSTTEPTTDLEARAAITAFVPTLKVSIVNGIPVVS